MGKRRIRCLNALGCRNVLGIDARQDRRAEVERDCSVRAFSTVEEAISQRRPDALLISVPPDVHHRYMKLAVERRIPFFVEASVVDDGMKDLIQEVRQAGVLAAPSATMLFHPAIRTIARIVGAGALGKISNVVVHTGQYLPDWHSYEQVSDFYVSNPRTGGAREIVPFELTWLSSLFGFPVRVAANFRKTINIPGAEQIDDTYNLLLDYGSFLTSLTVDVVSRHATRRVLINGELKQLVWEWDQECVRLYDPQSGSWEKMTYDAGTATPGYDTRIGESMYVEEIRAFLAAVTGQQAFVNTLENDWRVLQLLYAAEQSDRTSRFVPVEA